jgi:GDP-L-fucose synthase
MQPNSKIYVAGHTGMVGSAISRLLKQQGYTNLIERSSKDLDLKEQHATEEFFRMNRPEYVFLAAAKVGGIVANNSFRADFLYDNLMIEANIIRASWKYAVKKLLFLGSSCIYPKYAPQPIKEEYLLTGTLEPTNEPYAIAKIAGIKLCEAYHDQYGSNFISVMPTNLYGKGDNYHPENSHVLPALIRRFHEAKLNGSKEVVIWGTGTPKREFLYADDLASACFFLMQNYNDRLPVNVGTGTDISIAELAGLIKTITGFEGTIAYDHTRPDGTPRKWLDVTRLNDLGWKYHTGLEEGIRLAYADFLSKQLQVA